MLETPGRPRILLEITISLLNLKPLIAYLASVALAAGCGDPAGKPSPPSVSARPVATTAQPAASSPSADCGLGVSVTLSPWIKTVGIATLSGLDADSKDAYIEFGKDTNYGMQAPIDPADADTLLLGMEASSTYHYRAVGSSGGEPCTSPDATLKTGTLPNAASNIQVVTQDATQLAPGFLVASIYGSSDTAPSPAFILNAAGKPVWAYNAMTQLMRARQSYDGKYMWLIKSNVPQGGADVRRVRMDGSDERNYTEQFGEANHDLAVLPDERVAFAAYGNGSNEECENVEIKLFDPKTETTTTLADGAKLNVDGGQICHVNAIQYLDVDQTLVFSDLGNNSFTKLDLTGNKIWTLGNKVSPNDFSGEDATWDRQHGFQLLGTDRILFFNNGATGGGGGATSAAIELQLDLTRMTATKTWEYLPEPGINAAVMGDVQRLPNGNTLVNFSSKGTMHEVTAEKTVVQTLTAIGTGVVFGYSEKRESLYGKPPR